MIDEVIKFAREYIDVEAFRTTARKIKIRKAYEELIGKKLKPSCSTCYIEALLEIINLKKIKMATPNYELKKGVLLQAFGDASKTCTNATLTDELAQWYLRTYPEKAIYFSKISPLPDIEVKEEKTEPIKSEEIPDPLKIVNDITNPPVPELNAKQQILKDLNDSINNKEEKPEPKKTTRKNAKKPK